MKYEKKKQFSDLGSYLIGEVKIIYGGDLVVVGIGSLDFRLVEAQ